MLYKSNGQTIEYDVSELDSIAFSEKKPKYVTSFTLSETSITLQPDETKTLTATVLPADADNKALAWTSSDEAVVEVNKNGRIIANANDTYVITYSATDGSGVKAECQMTVTSDNLGTINGRDYVDLGLPSGTKWATCNVGASSPEEYGDYFAWGETEPKDTYNWDTYFDSDDDGDTFNKYNNNGGLTELLPEDDAAAVNWGGSWRMPTKAQQDELREYCTREWTTLNGVNGTLVTGPNGNTIFLPAAGLRWYDDFGSGVSYGYYWSSSLYPDNDYLAYYLSFDSGGWGWGGDNRGSGRSVRPVCP